MKETDFQEYFKEKTGGTPCGQFSNALDFELFKNGFKIVFAGGIVPERFWSYGDYHWITVRNSEYEHLTYGPIPADCSQLVIEAINTRRGYKIFNT